MAAERRQPAMADAGAGAGNRGLDLPVVDLSSSDLAAAAESIRKACVEYGFFYVINHGVEEGLLEKVFAESRRFSEQPMEEKMTLRWNSSHMGYTPPHTERLDASCKFRELNENFSIGPIGSEGSDNDANQWPSEAFSMLEGDNEVVLCNWNGNWKKDTLSNCSEFESRRWIL